MVVGTSARRPRAVFCVVGACASACAIGTWRAGGLTWSAPTPREWVLGADAVTTRADAGEAAMAMANECVGANERWEGGERRA